MRDRKANGDLTGIRGEEVSDLTQQDLDRLVKACLSYEESLTAQMRVMAAEGADIEWIEDEIHEVNLLSRHVGRLWLSARHDL